MVGKTGVASPLIRPTGTFSPRGEEGIERSRHGPFAPQAGVRRTGRDQWLDPGKGGGSRMRGGPKREFVDVVSITGGTRPPVMHFGQTVRYFCSGAKNSAQ
ncbi:hypothetical protein ACVIRO_003173 [Rhizobium ruizarguesonis]